jgi:hypothetical protein
MKYYFDDNDGEYSHNLQFYKDLIKDNNLKELKLFEASVVKGTNMFFCKKLGEIGEVGQDCGKMCGNYSPRNGKNGRCRFSGHVYEPNEDKVKILKAK